MHRRDGDSIDHPSQPREMRVHCDSHLGHQFVQLLTAGSLGANECRGSACVRYQSASPLTHRASTPPLFPSRRRDGQRCCILCRCNHRSCEGTRAIVGYPCPETSGNPVWCRSAIWWFFTPNVYEILLPEQGCPHCRRARHEREGMHRSPVSSMVVGRLYLGAWLSDGSSTGTGRCCDGVLRRSLSA